MAEQTSRLAIIIDSAAAQKGAENLSTALEKMTQSGDKAAASADKVSKASQDEKQALDKLRAAIDPVGAAIDTVGRRFSELKKYFDKGLIEKEEFQFLSKKLNETTDELSGVAHAQREAEKAARAAAAQQDSQARSFQKMLDSIDPVSAALRNLDQQQKNIYLGAQAGLITTGQYEQYSAKIEEARREVTGLAQAERDAIKAQEQQSQSFQRMIDRIDPLSAALKNLDAQQRELSNALAAGRINTAQFDTYSSKLAQTRKEVTGEAQAEREAAKAHDEQVAALRRLEAQLDPIGEGFRRLAQQQKQLDSAKSSGLLSEDTYNKLSSSLGDMRSELERTQSQLGKTGVSAKQTAAAMRMVPAQLTDIVVSLQGGQAPLTVLLQQGGQLKDMFGGIGPAAKALGGYVVGLVNPFTVAAAALGTLSLAYYKGSQEQDEFYKSLTLTGNQVGKTSGQLADIAARVSSSTNATTGAAAATLNQLVSSGKVAAGSLEQVTTAIVKTSSATGIATDKLVDDFNKIAANPLEAISKLNDQYHFLTLATYNQIKALQDQGNQQEAARVANEAYSSSLIQRSNDIKNNLGTLERAWNAIAGAAKSAWDSMLDVGREISVEQKITDASEELDRAQRALADLEKGQAANAGPYGAWKSDDISRQQKAVTILRQRLASLRDEKVAQDVLNDSINSYNKRQQDGIDLQQKSDAFSSKYQTRQQQMTKELRELNDLKAKGAKLDFDSLEAQIRDRYKEPKPKKEKAYAEDAATRLLDQLNQQTAAMQSQLDASDKINSATQARIKFEQQIADLKSKTQLTADQKSILGRSDEILQAYRIQEALQNQVKTLDDYQKMQEQVKSKDEQTNDLLRERIALLEKAKATGKLKPGEYEQTRDNIYKNTPVELPSTVKSVVGNLNPIGGQLSGTFGGMQTQYNQLDQAQQQLQQWIQAQEAAYAKAGEITAEGEARMTAIRQQAAQANQAIEVQKYEIITSATQSMMDSGLQILATGFGEQSGIYKAAFAVSKAFAIAQSLVSIQQGIAMAAANPFPANIAAMASVAAATASIVTNIASVADTGFMSGGYTGNIGTRSVAGAVHGQEYVFDAASTKNIGVSTLDSIRKNGLDATLSKPGYGTGAQNISNSSSHSNTFSPQVNQYFESPGVTPEQVAASSSRAVKQALDITATQIMSGDGRVGKALRAKYSSRRAE